MKRLFSVLGMLFLCLAFSVNAMAAEVISNENGFKFWADSSYRDDVINTLFLEGTGSGQIRLYTENTGSYSDTVSVSVTGCEKKFDLPSGVLAFDLVGTGKFWASKAYTSNPNSQVWFGGRPSDYLDYMSESCGDPPVDPVDPTDPTDPTDPGDGSGESCLCCQAVADMLGQLKQSMDSSGLQLGGIQGVMSQLNGAIEQQGYKLDEMKVVLHDVSDKLDTANDHLSNISDQVTPTGSYEIDLPDWADLMQGEDVPYLNQIQPVRDNNTYFSDPGEGDQVPAMPEQPDENYPVPIGESFGRQEPITAQPSLSPELPKTTAPVGQASPVLTPQNPLNVIPMQAEPVRQKDQMSADPIRQRDPVMADPVRQRTHIYEKQEVPGK